MLSRKGRQEWKTCLFKDLEWTSDKRWEWSAGDGVSLSFLLSLFVSRFPLQEAASSFAYECLTELIKSSLFYRRELIELATLPSLGSFSLY